MNKPKQDSAPNTYHLYNAGTDTDLGEIYLKLRSPIVLATIGVVATLVLALAVVTILLLTGDSKAVTDNAAVIGALIALGGVFTAQLVSISLEGQRTQETRELEDLRARETRELEDLRANEAALQNYFEQVGALLIEQPLHRASPGDELSTIVRAQTLSVLEGLDPERKRILVLFLSESGLIRADKPVLSLLYANLKGIPLGLSLEGPFLLGNVNLSGSYMRAAQMSDASLSRSNFSHAFLGEADLSGADLSIVNLSNARLFKADLTGADLTGADLTGAKLAGAYLREANLTGATGITSEALEQQARTLEGAIMPDGSTHP